MKIENQLCSNNQGIKLKELGVSQNSIWHFDYDIYLFRPDEGIQLSSACKRNYKCYSLFTVAELSIMLGAYAETYLTTDNSWKCGDAEISFDTQAESSADRLMYCLENELLSIEVVNKRLIN